jgi:hypothetical protein
MNQEEIKKEVKVDNSAYRDRFRFLFSANDNIVCERFFKINHFNLTSLYSEELKDTIDAIVENIQNDMKSKSRIYDWYTTTTPVKITGFKPNGMGLQNKDSEYITYPEKPQESEENKEYVETAILEPYAVTFKFDFQMAQKIETNPEDNKPIFSDYKSIYSAIWDGTVYQKDIRNSVDLSNSIASYKDSDINSMNFIRTLNYRMVNGKTDLIYDTIKRICETTSGEGKTYTNNVYYGTQHIVSTKEGNSFKKCKGKFYETRSDEGIEYTDIYTSPDGKYYTKRLDGNYMELIEYTLDPYGKYLKGWEAAVKAKTDEYRRSLR